MKMKPKNHNYGVFSLGLRIRPLLDHNFDTYQSLKYRTKFFCVAPDTLIGLGDTLRDGILQNHYSHNLSLDDMIFGFENMKRMMGERNKTLLDRLKSFFK